MARIKSIEVRLLNGKSRALAISSDDDVLVISGALGLQFLLAVEHLVAHVRATYHTEYEPVPRELRRTGDGLILLATSASFHLKRREKRAYFEVAAEVVREMLERANRDPSEIAHWTDSPGRKTAGGTRASQESGSTSTAKTAARKRTSKSEGILAILESLAASGPWGKSARDVAKYAHCSLGFFYRFLRDNPNARRMWKRYQSAGRGRGPISRRDL